MMQKKTEQRREEFNSFVKRISYLKGKLLTVNIAPIPEAKQDAKLNRFIPERRVPWLRGRSATAEVHRLGIDLRIRLKDRSQGAAVLKANRSFRQHSR